MTKLGELDLSAVPFKPYYQDASCVIYNADCKEVLPHLPKFDLLLTDPPYGLGDKWKGGCWKTVSGRLWSGSVPKWDETTVGDIPLSISSLAIVWGGNYYQFEPNNSWLVWDKVQKHSGSEAELAWTNLDIPIRVFRMSRVEAYCGKDDKVHPTQKPLPLMKWCLSFAPEAKTVLDPFMGSGTTLVAAKLEGRKAVGIELSEEYCEKAANRLRQGVLFDENA